MEHPNRGKRSIGLALENPAAYEVLLDLVRDADIFLINFLPDARRRLKLDVEDIRKVNPNIIYVRGSGHGQRGHGRGEGRLRRLDLLVPRRHRVVGHARPTAPA